MIQSTPWGALGLKVVQSVPYFSSDSRGFRVPLGGAQSMEVDKNVGFMYIIFVWFRYDHIRINKVEFLLDYPILIVYYLVSTYYP